MSCHLRERFPSAIRASLDHKARQAVRLGLSELGLTSAHVRLTSGSPKAHFGSLRAHQKVVDLQRLAHFSGIFSHLFFRSGEPVRRRFVRLVWSRFFPSCVPLASQLEVVQAEDASHLVPVVSQLQVSAAQRSSRLNRDFAGFFVVDDELAVSAPPPSSNKIKISKSGGSMELP
jgi:hypothetical protein